MRRIFPLLVFSVGLVCATQAALAGTVVYTSTNNGGTAIVATFDVVTSGTYQLQVEGAAGGSANFYSPQTGGTGANLIGDVTLTAGEILDIVVGAEGGKADGGGGSYVYITGPSTLLLDAGGGGGAGAFGGGSNAAAGTAGSNPGNYGGAGGTNGGNGVQGTDDGSAGDGGHGGDGYNSGNENGGSDETSYGGGAGGGGGGYSGGGGGGVFGAGYGGGAGGSYIASSITNSVDTYGSGANKAGGDVILTLENATAVTPEPSSFLLMGTGMLAAFGAMRRRLRV